jgi:hypothetical protein
MVIGSSMSDLGGHNHTRDWNEPTPYVKEWLSKHVAVQKEISGEREAKQGCHRPVPGIASDRFFDEMGIRVHRAIDRNDGIRSRKHE